MRVVDSLMHYGVGRDCSAVSTRRSTLWPPGQLIAAAGHEVGSGYRGEAELKDIAQDIGVGKISCAPNALKERPATLPQLG